jgi:co-chaperonin GroES (HSP10)
MFQPPINNLVIKVSSKYAAEVSNAVKRAALNPQSEINPADYVNIVGEVAALPKRITTEKRGYEGYSTKDIYVGDTVIFRYDVIFSFIEHADGTASFKNLVYYKHKEYFLADIMQIFGVIRGDEIIMVNGNCMIEFQGKPPMIYVPQSAKHQAKAVSGMLTQIGNNLTTRKKINAESGDTIYFNKALLAEYQVNGKKFGILSQKQILGKKTSLINW